MRTEGLFRAGPALAIGAFSIQVLAVGRKCARQVPSGVSDYFRPWIAMAEAHDKAEAAIITRNGFTVDFAIPIPHLPIGEAAYFSTNVF